MNRGEPMNGQDDEQRRVEHWPDCNFQADVVRCCEMVNHVFQDCPK